MSLCHFYAVSGIDMAYGAMCLRACRAMSIADIGYGATCRHLCSALCGTDIAYGDISVARRLVEHGEHARRRAGT